MITYRHPQGATIVVHDNGTMTVTDKNGKPKKTSATPEKLAAGHGGWTVVANADEPPPPMPKAPPSGVIRRPMRFAQAEYKAVLDAVHDDNWVMQQKLDGIRAQLVITANGGAYARASSGEVLKSTTAGPIAAKVLNGIDRRSARGLPVASVVLDGEIVDGMWWMFDLTTDDTSRDKTTYEQRLIDLLTFMINHDGLSPYLQVLPTAKSSEEKAALLERVLKGAAEGVLIKHLDGTYNYDARVTHSLKFKVTHTVDCVVMARAGKGRDNVTLGLWSGVLGTGLIEIGNASMIGKVEAEVGDVLEIKYLYAGAGNRLVQPTVLRKRTDKVAADCTIDQLVFTNKEVLA